MLHLADAASGPINMFASSNAAAGMLMRLCWEHTFNIPWCKQPILKTPREGIVCELRRSLPHSEDQQLGGRASQVISPVRECGQVLPNMQPACPLAGCSAHLFEVT